MPTIKLSDFHAGNLIISFLKKSNIPQAHLARELNMATSNVNRLLKRDSMETSLLLEISNKLNHNFFADISGDVQEGKPYTLVSPQIGKHIEERLKELKMTQSQFAAILNVTPAEVSRLIRKESFDVQKLLKICRTLNYDFFRDFYRYIDKTEENKFGGWASLLKRNEELVAENTRMKEYLREVYSKMQKFKEDNDVSIDNWDSLVKREGVDVMNMASFFFLETKIKNYLDELEQKDSSSSPENGK